MVRNSGETMRISKSTTSGLVLRSGHQINSPPRDLVGILHAENETFQIRVLLLERFCAQHLTVAHPETSAGQSCNIVDLFINLYLNGFRDDSQETGHPGQIL
jgi:hypothetical protein